MKLVHVLLLQTIDMVSSEAPILVTKPEIFIFEGLLLKLLRVIKHSLFVVPAA